MIITIKGNRKDIYIYNINEFNDFVNSVISNIKIGFINEKVINYYNENVNSIIGFKKIKTDIKSLFFNKTILNTEYWTSRGWSNEYSVNKIKETQLERSKISYEKMIKLKNDDEFKWKSLMNTQIEYYINKGYSKEDSIILRKNRQSTFSKDICIRKNGYELGISIWKDRQNRWIKSLNNNIERCGKFNTDSSSLNFFKNKFSDNYLIEAIKSNYSICNKELIINSLENTNNIEEFCKYISENKNIYSISELSSIFNSKNTNRLF